jgi:hypothetical protein
MECCLSLNWAFGWIWIDMRFNCDCETLFSNSQKISAPFKTNQTSEKYYHKHRCKIKLYDFTEAPFRWAAKQGWKLKRTTWLIIHAFIWLCIMLNDILRKWLYWSTVCSHCLKVLTHPSSADLQGNSPIQKKKEFT